MTGPSPRVLKFGGSSLASTEGRRNALAIIERSYRRGPVAVVVSALGGVTDHLAAAVEMGGRGLDEALRAVHLRALTESLGAAPSDAVAQPLGELFEELKEVLRREPEDLRRRESRDRVLSIGERASVTVMAALLDTAGITVTTSDEAPIRTDSTFGNARPLAMPTREFLLPLAAQSFSSGSVLLLPGFLGVDRRGRRTTLGRGGSDYSGALVAAALGAERLEIWSDVDGLLAADPRWVPRAATLPAVSYREAEQLARFGAKVLDRRTPRPLKNLAIPIHLRNTFRPAAPGTRVLDGPDRIQGLALATCRAYFQSDGPDDGALVLFRPNGEAVRVRTLEVQAARSGPRTAVPVSLLAALSSPFGGPELNEILARVGVTPLAEKGGGVHLMLLPENDLPRAMVALHQGAGAYFRRRKAS
ncbi:MAG: aspartate kinase [Acidobacteriota bacterium]